MTAAIRVEELGKRFRQYLDRGSLLSRLTRRTGGRDVQEIWALRDVDFEVERGGTLGIIGRNGSGKTTLLRLLSGISGPSEGRLRVEGRIASLIGIGVGFNRELTGRENVRINGRLLGMAPAEITEKYDRIVAFAELEEYMDLPVKFYSSGMFLRLAFSIAIHTDPDVLLIDEILAVGDVGFQTRCFDRMRDLQDDGATVVVVTHNLQVLQRLTERTLVLDHGRVRFDGDTERALEIYHDVLEEHADATPQAVVPGRPTFSNIARLDVSMEDDEGRTGTQVRARRPMAVHVHVTFTKPVEDPVVQVAIERPGFGMIFGTASVPRGSGHPYGPDRPLHARVELADVPLLPSTYSVTAQIRSARGSEVLGMTRSRAFHVSGDGVGAGLVDFGPSMQLDGVPVDVVRPRLGAGTGS